MKTNLMTAAALTMLAAIAGCSKEPAATGSDEPVAMKVQTSVTKAPISAIPDGESIGLFVTTGTLGTNYADNSAYANVKSTVSSDVWTNDPVVYLTSASATVFAYYPYSSTVTDGTAIAVETASQADYLYAQGATTVNNTTPQVSLTMKHALSLIQFKINKQDYPGTGELTKITIANKAAGTTLASEGTLNIATGTITPTAGKNEAVVLDATLTIPDDAPGAPQTGLDMLVLPANIAAAGDVTITFTIDGNNYTYEVPVANWEKGKKNIYTMVLKGTQMTGTVSVDVWGDGVTGGGDLQ